MAKDKTYLLASPKDGTHTLLNWLNRNHGTEYTHFGGSLATVFDLWIAMPGNADKTPQGFLDEIVNKAGNGDGTIPDKIFSVPAWPPSFTVASSLYFVTNGNFDDLYVTNSSNQATKIGLIKPSDVVTIAAEVTQEAIEVLKSEMCNASGNPIFI
jgi:hypothetical protein